VTDPWRSATGASVEEARLAVLAALATPRVEEVALDVAVGRMAATGLSAPSAWPARDTARLDGVAVRAADLDGASVARPRVLVVLGETGPGEAAGRLSEGTAWRVRTGAPMPDGADAVVPAEDVGDEGESVMVARAVRAGYGVEPEGCDVPAGTRLLVPGGAISPRMAALLLAFGIASVRVFHRPRVAIIVTGSEYDPGTGITPSNGPMLAGLVREAGGTVSSLGTCPDVASTLARTLLGSLPCDLVLTSGGTGRSAADRVPAAFELARAEPLFRGLAARPGHTTMAARLEGCPVLALPGVPAAAAVVFELLVRPALCHLLGTSPLPPRELPLAAAIPAGRPGRRMVWGRLGGTAASPAIEPLVGPSWGPSLAAALGDVLVDIPDGGQPTPLGSLVVVLPAGLSSAVR